LETSNLLAVCAIAFGMVFALLALLAVAMHGIVALFPERERGSDLAVMAAIATAVTSVIPGARVTHIEED
jgi:hypothetical protein